MLASTTAAWLVPATTKPRAHCLTHHHQLRPPRMKGWTCLIAKPERPGRPAFDCLPLLGYYCETVTVTVCHNSVQDRYYSAHETHLKVCQPCKCIGQGNVKALQVAVTERQRCQARDSVQCRQEAAAPRQAVICGHQAQVAQM